MATQPPITSFFASRKRRANDVLQREAKLYKSDPTLLKFGPVTSTEQDVKIPTASQDANKQETVEKDLVKYLASTTNNRPKAVKQSKLKLVKADENKDIVPKAEVKLEITPVPQKAAEILGHTQEEINDIVPKAEVKIEITPVPQKAAEILGHTQEEIMRQPPVTPRKEERTISSKSPGYDMKSFMTTKSPYRPECRSETPVKYFRMEVKSRENDKTPGKTPGSIMKSQDRPPSAVKKSIRFDDSNIPCSTADPPAEPAEPQPEETDDIIKAANDLVEKLKNKSRGLSDITQSKSGKKAEVMTAGLLKKKLARTAKLAELKSSLNRLGQQASELIKIEKKKKESEQPKIHKFDSIEINVPRSPHKGALASPLKSPAKPAYERFAHLIHRSGQTAAASLPLPLGYQKLFDLFTATDTVCSMMLNRGEIITFKKLKQPVQELTRSNVTERHLGQMVAVLPSAFTFKQEKLRNFGSTSKIDRYELVVTPNIDFNPSGNQDKVSETSNLITAADRKKMTPRIMLQRKEAFHKNLLERTVDKHTEFLASLEPPLKVLRAELTRWHPNFPVDMVPDVPPVCLPEPPNAGQQASSAKEALERAAKMLAANARMKNALEAVSAQTAPEYSAPEKPQLSAEVKVEIDKRVAAHDPLKGISKSLLDKIRAKQAAKAMEAMKMTPDDEKELLLLSKLPDMASRVRLLFVNSNKNVMPWDTVVEKIVFSANRLTAKGDVEKTLRRLLKEVPSDWLSVFTAVSGGEHVKLNRTMDSKPVIEKLQKQATDKRRALS